MKESVLKDSQPRAIKLKDYKVPAYRVNSTDLKVSLYEDAAFVEARVEFSRNPESEDAGKLILQGGEDLELIAISVDGRELKSNEYGREGEELVLYDVPEKFILGTRVAIRPQENTSLEGLYKSGNMFCTQCEAEGFRKITFYPDRPDVLSVFRTTIEADKESCPVLLSNGNEVSRGEAGEGRHWVCWEDPFPKPAYLFALVAGKLEYVEDDFVTRSGRNICIRIFAESKDLDKLGFSMQSLKAAMAWDEKVYGREYDLDIFMIVAVDSFNMGAMENKGLNIFNTSCVLASPETTPDAAYQRVEAVVAHEYFHNWSGNRVTCRDWFQLSLKEGFTVFRDQQFSSDMGSPVVNRIDQVTLLRTMQFPEDAGPMAHPVRPDSYIEINNFYTLTVYEKGAEVVRMIHTLLGPDRFRKGTDLYFSQHDGKAVTTEDFVLAMEEANGVSLDQFRRWYSQAGTPHIRLSDSYDADSRIYQLKVDQSCYAGSSRSAQKPFHIPLALGLLDGEGNDQVFEPEEADVSSLDRSDGKFTAVLNLVNDTQLFTLKEVSHKPVPSFFRGFSAPVKYDYEYSRDELLFLMTHDSDGFNRWDAGQKLAVNVLLEVITSIQAGLKPDVDSRLTLAFQRLLEQAVEKHSEESLDKSMLARMLSLPAATWLGEQLEVFDVDAVCLGRDLVREAITRSLGGLLLSVYKLNHIRKPYQPQPGDVGERALKNICLGYLLEPDTSEFCDLGMQQFESANNMTDIFSALQALVLSRAGKAAEFRETALQKFHERWRHEALVIDRWFTVQALTRETDALAKVSALTRHRDFVYSSPNRVRSLIGPFTQQNLTSFHQVNGEGYRFLADQVIKLDVLNPQLAARLLTPLSRWHRFDESRQEKMKSELARIGDREKLSTDVYEIVSKSLGINEDNTSSAAAT